MKRFTDAGRQAVQKENWYAALSLGLIVPEICASLEDPGPGKSQSRYVAWARKWLQPRFTSTMYGGEEHVWLSAENIYQARCSVIHSGTAEIEESKRKNLDRFEFFTGGPHLIECPGNTVGGVVQPKFLQLRVDKFCETVFEAAEEWDVAVAGDEKIQAEKAKLLVIHSPGTVVGGLKFG